MDTPPFERDRYPPGEWTPWTRTGAEAWRMVGRMAGAVIWVALFTAATAWETEFRWEGRFPDGPWCARGRRGGTESQGRELRRAPSPPLTARRRLRWSHAPAEKNPPHPRRDRCAVIVCAATFWEDIVTRYYLHRLGGEPGYLEKILEEPEGTAARAAVREYVKNEKVRRRYFGLYLGGIPPGSKQCRILT